MRAVKSTILDREERALIAALQSWRRRVLKSIEAQMRELSEDFRDAQDGLEIARCNPGEVAQDVIEYLYEQLNSRATELTQLEEQHETVMFLDLAHLIVTYQRSKKEKTNPWESERWELQIC